MMRSNRTAKFKLVKAAVLVKKRYSWRIYHLALVGIDSVYSVPQIIIGVTDDDEGQIASSKEDGLMPLFPRLACCCGIA